MPSEEEISILGATLNDLAKEKECLQACLDKKSENIASLGESLAMKVCSENCDLKEMFELNLNKIISFPNFFPKRGGTLNLILKYFKIVLGNICSNSLANIFK